MPWDWPLSVMKQAPEQSWACLPLLCLGHHCGTRTIGQFKILSSKKGSVRAPTDEDTKSSRVLNLLSSGEDLTSSHPPPIPKSEREIVWASPTPHTSSVFQLLLEGKEAALAFNYPSVYLRLNSMPYCPGQIAILPKILLTN